ncbi:MAG: metallophosphoesterase family protein [Firmicutes bacterium]|nr:metallophosphoesterase family protein [Bacillota bacterium]
MRARCLPAEIFMAFGGVDLILHAGDIMEWSVIEELSTVAPVKAVYGNMDYPEVRHRIPRRQMIEIGGLKIGLIHGDGAGYNTLARARQAFSEVDCIVFGHSHRPYNQLHNGILLFNPGSPTDRRMMPMGSYGFLQIRDGKIWGEHRYIEPAQ